MFDSEFDSLRSDVVNELKLDMKQSPHLGDHPIAWLKSTNILIYSRQEASQSEKRMCIPPSKLQINYSNNCTTHSNLLHPIHRILECTSVRKIWSLLKDFTVNKFSHS